MANRKDIENTKHTVEGLAEMAVALGYKSCFNQLTLRNGHSVSDILEFFEDNPGAVEAVIEWVLEKGCNSDGSSLEEEDDSDEDEDEDQDEDLKFWLGVE